MWEAGYPARPAITACAGSGTLAMHCPFSAGSNHGTHDATVFTCICTSLAPQGALRRHLHSVHVPPKITKRTRGGVAEIVAHRTFIATSDLNS
jgi:hypothetical protein